MIYEIKPVSVSHESILALRLHEQCLMSDYERITLSADGRQSCENKSVTDAQKELKKRMLDCQKARGVLENWLIEELEIGDIKENY